MIIRKSAASLRASRYGCSSDSVEVAPEMVDSVLYCLPQRVSFPLSALPLRRRSLARVAFIGSSRVRDGLVWHLTCHELSRHNWRHVLGLMKPDYLLVESCLYDSRREWNLTAFDKADYAGQMQRLADQARSKGIPSIYWYTLGADVVDFFADGMRAFDIVACADVRALEVLRRHGLEARLLPWAFSPEQYNPLTNFKLTTTKPFLLFDGTTRMIRFPHVQETLEPLADCDLQIIDSGMLTSSYNLSHFKNKNLSARVCGCVSQTRIHDLYKMATAYLSIPDFPERLTPAGNWRGLEAAACRVPVLHAGRLPADAFLAGFVETFASSGEIRERYEQLKREPLEQERSGHKAWRMVHQRHTFAHRIDTWHGWLGLNRPAMEMPLATVLTPSMRPENQAQALARYRAQTWPNKEFVFVMNGDIEQADVLLEEARTSPDVRVIHVPREFSTGMVMNAGLKASCGEYVFKFDDDDLYGVEYVSDRMIYFREFDVRVMGTGRSFFAFKGGDRAFTFNKSALRQDKIATSLGNIEYSLSSFSGATVAMQRKYALHVGYQEQAYANADVSFLYKGIFFASATPSINMDVLNFCVQRGDPSEHTWAASKDELLRMSRGDDIPLEKIFL